MSLLSLQSVYKSFGPQKVIQDLHLEIGDSELVVLVGKSGCGKTTTLRLIAGLETPDEGKIFFSGKPAESLAPKDRPVAMVFQSGGYYAHMNVYQNLAFVLKSRRISRADREHRALEIAELLGLESLLQRMPAELSGGQLQRLTLGRALVRECKLMLLDEPLSHLDLALRHRLRDELVELQSKLRLAMLYVTHDPSEALMMADRVAVMDSGKVLQCESPESTYTRPAFRLVANSVGWPAMHFVDGRLNISNDQLHLQVLGQSLLLPIETIGTESVMTIKNCRTETSCDVGVRPEDWYVDTNDTLSPENLCLTSQPSLKVHAQVIGHAFLGSGWLWTLKSESNEPLVWLQPRSQHLELPEKSKVSVQVPIARLNLFDSRTGQRL